MPATFAPDASGRFAILTLTDPYSIDEWRHAMLGVFNDPVFQAHAALLIDRRVAAPPSIAFVKATVEFASKHPGQVEGGRVAIVVADDASFGMGRMTQLTGQFKSPGAAVRPFRDYDEAVRWLLTPEAT